MAKNYNHPRWASLSAAVGIVSAIFLLSSIIVPLSQASAVSIFRTITIGHGEQSDIATNSAAGAAGRVYVTNNYDDTITVMNTNNLNLVATIAVGDNPVSVAVDKGLNKIYTANQDANTVTVINAATNAIIATITGIETPNSIRVNSVTHKAYVANSQIVAPNTSLTTVINTSTDTIIKTIEVGANPFNIAINENLNRIYVTNTASQSVSVIDGSTDTVTTTWITLLPSPLGVAIDTDANKVYVTNFQIGDGFVTVYDGNTNQQLKTIDVGANSEPYYIACDNTNRNECYVTNLVGNFATIIDQTTDTVESTLTNPSAGESIVGLAGDPDRSRVYVVTGNPEDATHVQKLLVVNT